MLWVSIESGVAAEPRDVQLERKTILKNALRKMKLSRDRADTFLQDAGIEKKPLDLRGLPDGESLIFQLLLKEEKVGIEGTVLAEVNEGTVIFSFADIISVLNFPIAFDSQSGKASGWFVREDRVFNLDLQTGLIQARGKEFRIDDRFVVRGDDLYVPLSDVEEWFDLTLDVDVSTQQVLLDADPPLPLMDQLRRRKFDGRNRRIGPASLPRGDDDYDLIAFPLLDVNTTTTLSKPDKGDTNTRRTFNVRSAGDFAYGSLATSIAGDGDNQVTSVQARYLQESNEPELLGPLKARRFEAGDVLPTFLPITGDAAVETGARITNADPFARQRLPRTQISGYIFPNWDVELYREGALISFQETDENGFYLFDNVDLFSNENAFRVVAYGPQGEVREEEISVPLDLNRDAREGITYDASLTLQETQTYRKFSNDDDPDKDTPHFVGFIEAPITGDTALLLGARYRQEEGDDKLYASAGVSTIVQGTLLNADVASDESGEYAAELFASRRFGPHAVRGDVRVRSDEFDPGQDDIAVDVFDGSLSVEGPLPFLQKNRSRYSVSAGYDEDSEGESNISGLANLNMTVAGLGLNQTFSYDDASENPQDAEISGLTALSGSFGKNFFRGLANYNFAPEGELETLSASWRRRVNQDLETTLEVSRNVDTEINRYSAFVNWRPDYATITPSLSVDSENNITGTLNTRFGLTRIPEQGDFVFTREFVTTNGTINAFVFLDKNGNEQFDEGEDEALPGVRVRTPQNGQGAKTNDNGVAFIDRMTPNILTDVFIDERTLEDPFWIPAREGVSILPRTGTNSQVIMPVHLAGEMDGTVYARKPDGSTQPLRNLTLSLYDGDGKAVKATRVGGDGFYIFDLVPPGTYSLLVEEGGLPRNIRRPKPQTIEIGYDGTIIFGNDIFLESGKPDIPSEILADIKDYKDYHPHIDFSEADHSVVLNLGEYNSRLMTSVVWYHLNLRYAPIFENTHLYVPPSQSFAIPRTGQHVLRAGLRSENVDDAYNRCRAIVSRGLYCKIEILPKMVQPQKMAENTTP